MSQLFMISKFILLLREQTRNIILLAYLSSRAMMAFQVSERMAFRSMDINVENRAFR